jgi:hypothetical protein
LCLFVRCYREGDRDGVEDGDGEEDRDRDMEGETEAVEGGWIYSIEIKKCKIV